MRQARLTLTLCRLQRHFSTRQPAPTKQIPGAATTGTPWRRRGVCLPQIDWNAASEESSPQCEDRSANVPRQGDLNHEEIFSAIRLAIYHIFQDRQHLNNSLLNQNIFFYFGRYDSDIIHGMHRGLPDNFTIVPATLPRAG
jgi:hypothetical protein